MTQATGSRVQIAYIAESTFGTTPSTPQTQLIEFSSFSGNLTAETLTDPSINPSRQRSFSRRGNVAAAGDLEVVLCPSNYDDFLEAALMGTWTSNVLKVGTTRRSFAIEQGFTDIAQYRTFNGMVVNRMEVNVPVDGLVTATFGFMGTNTSAFSGTSIDATPTAITQKNKYFHEGGVFLEGGVPVAYFSAINYGLDNGYDPAYALGSTSVRDMTAGTVDITGTVTGLFESVSLYNKFVNNTESSLSYKLISDTDELTFLFPRVKYTAGALPVDGDGPVSVEMSFEAIYDSTEATSLKITRAV